MKASGNDIGEEKGWGEKKMTEIVATEVGASRQADCNAPPPLVKRRKVGLLSKYNPTSFLANTPASLKNLPYLTT